MGDGICRVKDMLLPEHEGVRYVVVWQGDHGAVMEVETLRKRGDVRVVVMEGRGLSRSRNRCMETALMWMNELGVRPEEGVLLLADDDEVLSDAVPQRVVGYYADHAEAQVVLWRVRTCDGGWLKRYPDREMAYAERPRWYYPSSVEMTMRATVAQGGCRFDERFGLGSEALCAGEEEVFVWDAMQMGWSVCLVPQVIAATDGDTTGRRVLDSEVLRSKGAVYARTLSPLAARVRMWREALGLWRRYKAPMCQMLRCMKEGALHISQKTKP